MEAVKILRNTKEYELPDYSPIRRSSVPHCNFSDYYLHNLSLPKGQIGVNLLRNQPVLTSSEKRTNKLSVQTTPSVPPISNFVTPTSEKYMAWPDGNIKTISPDARTEKTRRSPIKTNLPKIVKLHKPKKNRKAGRKYYVENFGKVSDLKEIFQKVAPERFLEKKPAWKKRISNSIINSPKVFTQRVDMKFTVKPNENHNSAIEILNDNANTSKGPLSILEKFEDMVSVNMQHVAKALVGSPADKRAVLRLKAEDMHVDLCELNDKIRGSEESLKVAISPFKSRNQKRIYATLSLPPLIQLDTIPKPTENIQDLHSTMPQKYVPDNNPAFNTSTVETVQQKPPTIKKNFHKKRKSLAAPAEVKELARDVKEKIENYKKIKKFCQKCKFDLLSKNLITPEEFAGQETEEQNKPLRIKSKELYEKALWQINNEKFNIHRRYNADSVSLEKFRRELKQLSKVTEKLGLENKYDARNSKNRLDLFISRSMYKKGKASVI